MSVDVTLLEPLVVDVTLDGPTFVEVEIPAGLPGPPGPPGPSGSGAGFSVTDYGALGNGTADDTASINAAIAAAPAGSTVHFPATSSYFRVSAAIPVAKALTIRGDGVAEIRQVTANTRLFAVTASNVRFDGLRLVGPQYTVAQSSSRAIDVVGTVAAPLSDIVVRDCRIESWGMYGVYLEHVTDFQVLNTNVSNIWYAAIAGVSVVRGGIRGNEVTNIVGTPNAYGIEVTRSSLASLALAPRSADVLIANNIVRNIPNWIGIGTHGGARITIQGNDIYGCKSAVDIVGSNNDVAVTAWASLDIKVDGNIIDSGVTDGSLAQGITVAGAGAVVGSPVELTTGSVTNNTIRGCGQQSNTNSAAIWCRQTSGLVISGNQILEASPFGLNLYYDNYGFVVSGNTIRDPWSNATTAVAVALRSQYNTGYIGGNAYLRGAKSATSVLAVGVSSSSNDATIALELGNDYNEAAAPTGVTSRMVTNLRAPLGAYAAAGGSILKQILVWTGPWNPGTIADGANATVAFALAGTAVGDIVLASHTQVIAAGVFIRADINAANSVRVTILNESGASQALASGTLRLEVLKHA